MKGSQRTRLSQKALKQPWNRFCTRWSFSNRRCFCGTRGTALKSTPNCNGGRRKLLTTSFVSARLLLDFFYPSNPEKDDVIVNDFDVPGFSTLLSNLTSPAVMKFKANMRRVNKWTIHFSWRRTEGPEYTNYDRQLMEDCAMALLKLGEKFVNACIATGLQIEGWAIPLQENFTRLYTYLLATQRVDEDHAPRPAVQICLERL